MAIDTQDNIASGRSKKKPRAGRNKRQRIYWVDALQAYKQQQEIEKPAMWAAMQGAAATAQQELADPDSTLTYLDEHTRRALYGSDNPDEAMAGGEAKEAGRGLARILLPLLLVLAGTLYAYHRAWQKVARVM